MNQHEAKKRITAILQELETATGQLVMDVTIRRIDITRVSDATRRHVRMVDIVLEVPEEVHKPGEGWEP